MISDQHLNATSYQTFLQVTARRYGITRPSDQQRYSEYTDGAGVHKQLAGNIINIEKRLAAWIRYIMNPINSIVELGDATTQVGKIICLIDRWKPKREPTTALDLFLLTSCISSCIFNYFWVSSYTTGC